MLPLQPRQLLSLFRQTFDWIQVEVTSHCNALCIYCPRTVFKESWEDRHLSLETFKRLKPVLSRTDLVHLQGWGEPLLNPSFFDMAALARAHGVDLVPHQTQPSIGHTANLHFVAALTHSHHPAEYNGPREVQDAVFRTPVRPVQGKFVLSDAPGLGLELDEQALRQRMIPWTSSSASG